MVPNKLLKISLAGMETEPKDIFINKNPINKTINKINEKLYVLESDNYSNGLKK